MTAIHQYTRKLRRSVIRYVWILVMFFLCSNQLSAQCPPNIDFEQGTFAGWQCWTGSFNGVINVAPTPPIAGRHDMFSIPPGNGFDAYGSFPKNCPNGSGHSVKIGNEITGTTADEISYTFTIPAGQNNYSLIYHYAIVLNDAGHPANQQPRMIIDVQNITDGVPLPCPLNPIIVNGSLPGFLRSLTNGPGNTAVYYKDWAAASLNLDGNAGKTIKLSFTVTGCGLNNGSHFGYAYVDVNPECSSSFVGATFCPDDTVVHITAPYGYQGYRWFNLANTTLGLQQVLTLQPPPLSGDSVFVELTPYSGYGCLATLTAHLWDTLTIQPHAGRDTTICSSVPVPLGAGPVLGLTYKWSPVTGLSDPNIANPIATPLVTTQYILSVTHDGGGCLTLDTVNVNVVDYDTTLLLLGPASYCTASGQSVSLKVNPGADSVQWYRNGFPIPGATLVQYNVTQTGSYYATLFSFAGCNFNTRVQQIDIYQSPVASFNVNNRNQCFNGNAFVLFNTSSMPTGTPLYRWDMGDGTILNTANVNYSYLLPGDYIVKMTISGAGACADSTTDTLHVYSSPKAGFFINDSTQCFKNNFFVFTDTSSIYSGAIQYHWDFGDAATATTKNATHSYAAPGTYTVTLRTDAPGACTDQVSYDVTVYPDPVAGFNVNALNQCYIGHQFNFTNTSVPAGATFNWSLGDGINTATTDVTHNYAVPGPYTVRLLVSTSNNCADSSTVNVNVYPMPFADFTVKPICTNLTVPLINKTINNTTSTMNYMWDLGDGQTSTLRNPVYSYPLPGTYTVKLTVNTAQCSVTGSSKEFTIRVDAPLSPVRYSVVDAVMNFPEQLKARPYGTTVLWSPATSLDSRTSYNPKFNGKDPQLYTIEMKTPSGCVTVDTQLVITHKKIEIYVPTAFTPNGNGKNDYLRPVLMGFEKVNYFRVFDRWGKLLFEMRSDKPGWNGKTGNQGQEIQTVIWMIEAVDIDGKVHHRQGTTILLR